MLLPTPIALLGPAVIGLRCWTKKQLQSVQSMVLDGNEAYATGMAIPKLCEYPVCKVYKFLHLKQSCVLESQHLQSVTNHIWKELQVAPSNTPAAH